MAARGYHRGHAMTFDEGRCLWEYDIDGVPVQDEPNRPCGYCTLPNRADGHDACLGELPGVRNACCGHGRPGEAYVQMEAQTAETLKGSKHDQQNRRD